MVPAIEALHDRFDVPLSVDTWRASVAGEAYRAGAVVGNDISGFADPDYLAVAADAGAAVVATHIRLGAAGPRPRAALRRRGRRGGARSWPSGPAGPGPRASPTRRIVLDAGLDLGKTAAQSLTLLRASDRLAALGWPLLLSASNKTFLGVLFDLEVGDRVERHPGRPRPRRQPRLPDPAGPRRPGGPPGVRHPGRRHGGELMASRSASTGGQSPSCWSTATIPTLVAEAVERPASASWSAAVTGSWPSRTSGATRSTWPRWPTAAPPRRSWPTGASWWSATSADSRPRRWRPSSAYLEDPLPTTVLVLAAGGGRVAPKLVAAVKAHGHVIVDQGGGRETPATGSGGGCGRRRSGLDAPAEALIEAHLGRGRQPAGRTARGAGRRLRRGARLGPGRGRAVPGRGRLGRPVGPSPTPSTPARPRSALEQLHRLLGGGERHPLVVLAILHRHVQSLLRVDSPAIRTEAQAAEAMGIAKGRKHLSGQEGARRASRRWGSAGIAEAIGLVADAEVDLKGASAWPRSWSWRCWWPGCAGWPGP